MRAWARPETIVVNEQFWNANAKMADIVLPATTMLERDDIGSASRDRFMIAMKRAIEPVGDARDDYDIFSGLSARLGAKEKFTEGRSSAAWLRHLYDLARDRAQDYDLTLPPFEAFWAEGEFELPPPVKPSVMLESYRTDPVANRLPTQSGKIEIFSTIARSDKTICAGIPRGTSPRNGAAHACEALPLHLISHQRRPAAQTVRPRRVSRASKVAKRTIPINPRDAQAPASARATPCASGTTAAVPGGSEEGRWREPGVSCCRRGRGTTLCAGGKRHAEKHGNRTAHTRQGTRVRGCIAHARQVEKFEASRRGHGVRATGVRRKHPQPVSTRGS